MNNDGVHGLKAGILQPLQFITESVMLLLQNGLGIRIFIKFGQGIGNFMYFFFVLPVQPYDFQPCFHMFAPYAPDKIW